jgi:hypothetical protein
VEQLAKNLVNGFFFIDNAFLAQNIRNDKIKLIKISNYVKGSALNALIRYVNLLFFDSFQIREKCSFLEQEKMVICYYLSNGKFFKLNPHNNLRKNILQPGYVNLL